MPACSPSGFLRSISIVTCILLGVAGEAAGQLRMTTYASGFTAPVAFVQDPTDRTVQFVVQQNGRIRVIRNGTVLATDFLNLAGAITFGGEQGLLGLAFAPDYTTSGRFYVNFSNPAGDTVVARFLRSANPLVADASSRFDLRWGGATGPAFIDQPFGNHQGGHLAFGPDGFLYIGLGDGGSGGDPGHRAQNPALLLGKMLRIDVNVPLNHASGYQVPASNPFVGGGGIGALPEIWAFGLRNPWRYNFDLPARGGTGALIIGDVGQGIWEEVDYQPPLRGGRNYGWRNREGAHVYDGSRPPAYLPLIDPIHEYDHSIGQSITGGMVYRGRALATLYRGRYFFADFVLSRVWSIALTINAMTGEATASGLTEHTAELGGSGAIGNVSSFGIDADGDLYIVSYGLGAILKVTIPGATLPAVTTQPANQLVTAGQNATFTVAATGTPSPTFQWQLSTNAGASWIDLSNTAPYSSVTTTTLTVTAATTALHGARFRAVATNAAGSSLSNAAILTVDGISLTPATLQFAATKNGAGGALVAVTPPQEVTVTFAGPLTAWTAAADQPWVQITNATGSGPGRFTVAIVNPGNVLGASTHVTSTITVTQPSGRTTVLPIVLDVRLAPATSAQPFGFVDTPINGATGVTGSIGVTGWSLDDVSVSGVKIYRNCLVGIDNPASCQNVNGASVVFVGDAAFLPGARPDVEAAFPSFPAAHRAGWGHLLLTNTLPHVTAPSNPRGGGQGMVTLFAYATDAEGHRTLLGQKTITLENDNGNRPFGAIDTPAPGGTVSGVFPNFGWALTPGTAKIPTNGSTMNVVLDGVAVGKVVYNQCRAGATNVPPVGTCRDDVATLFPSFTNITGGSGAIGSFLIDTQTLTNGLHTIAWGVIDDQGRNDGIGSRFFTVLNGTSGLVPTAAAAGSAGRASMLSALAEAPARPLGRAADLAWRSPSAREVSGRSGFNFDAPLETIHADASGVRHVRMPELGRVELQLGDDTSAGYLKANGTLRPLPPGSRLDTAAGRFTWSPGAGYIGRYDLVFLQGATQVPIAVTIQPATGARTGLIRAALDLPAANATVAGAFTVAGWALDTGAWHGAGVGAVHVWARRRDVPAAQPIFLGAADLGGLRPDVAAPFGPQFDRAGWGLTAGGLAPGRYDVTAYFWSTRTRQFEDARTVSVTVR